MAEITQWWEQEYKPGWLNEWESEPPWWRAMISSGGRCVYCGVDGSTDARLLAGFQSDHLVPVDPKRKDDWLNLVLACPNCNRIKRRYDPSHGAGPPRTEEDRARMIEDVKAEINRCIKDGRMTGRNMRSWRILQLTIRAQKRN
jgi:hypothetical protein